jgi:phosphoribosylformimino-5-aminoimidazole carboxamide ribotide isomerase
MRTALLPVIDLLNGKVVRGVAGRRSEYRLIQSPWSERADAMEIAKGVQDDWELNSFYVADLDAIQHDRPQWSIYQSLIVPGANLWLDCGVRERNRAEELLEVGVSQVIVGLETLADPELPGALVSEFGPERIVFSLDLMQGRPVSRYIWQAATPLEIVDRIVGAGIRSLILLDLAGVGVGGGIPTLPLCRQIRQLHPIMEIITGGGVRDANDVGAAIQSGADRVLVASALHDGRLQRRDFDD